MQLVPATICTPCGHPWIGCLRHATAGFACKGLTRIKRGKVPSFLHANRAKPSNFQNPPAPSTTRVSKRPAKQSSPPQKVDGAQLAPANFGNSQGGRGIKRPLVHLDSDVFARSERMRSYFGDVPASSTVRVNRKRGRPPDRSLEQAKQAVQRLRDAKGCPSVP